MGKGDSMIDERIKNAFFAVQADDFARSALWQQHNGRVKWEQDCRGLSQIVGHTGDMPTNLDISFATIDGKLVMFYYAVSALQDWRLVDKWMEDNVPAMGKLGAERHHCDANNFHNCLLTIEREQTKPLRMTLDERKGAKEKIIGKAEEYAVKFPQYRGHWSGNGPKWKLARMLKSIRGKGGQFHVGELVIATSDGCGKKDVLVWSAESQVDTLLNRNVLEWLEE